jgi:hypothetical protein
MEGIGRTSREAGCTAFSADGGRTLAPPWHFGPRVSVKKSTTITGAPHTHERRGRTISPVAV